MKSHHHPSPRQPSFGEDGTDLFSPLFSRQTAGRTARYHEPRGAEPVAAGLSGRRTEGDGNILLAGAWAAVLPVVLITAALAVAPEVSMSGVDPYREARERMVTTQVAARGVKDARVLNAMRHVPRHAFVPAEYQPQSYADQPLPIGEEQTISQPYIVALMTSLLEAEGDEKVLEIGTGSGYHAAIMSQVAGEVFSVEIVESLGRRAQALLRDLGYDNVHVRVADGYRGWPDEAPFDAIVLTAAPPTIPEPLVEQLKIGGKMVLPLGREVQELLVLERTADGLRRRSVTPVRFVPMTGEVQGGMQKGRFD